MYLFECFKIIKINYVVVNLKNMFNVQYIMSHAYLYNIIKLKLNKTIRIL